jgi:succinoglycan biosynthesis protein ExoA
MVRVSIIVPCYNEESTIAQLLDAIFHQTFPVKDIEVIIADGQSTDATRERIHDFSQLHPDLSIRVINNPRRYIPSALNRAIEASTGEYIVRMDAHSIPERDYVSTCIADLDAGKGENVGGVWKIVPPRDHWISKSIALAASHPLGVGDARYRYSSKPGWVDTVPFGAFRRELFDRIGNYDEDLLTNEDYEFNARIKRNGGRIWFNPQIRCTYYARENLNALARQYWRYGFWKWRMLKKDPTTLRWRQALPPLFVGILLLSAVTSPWILWSRYLLAAVITLYVITLFLSSSLTMKRSTSLWTIVGVPLAIATMHITWGAGFLWSMVKSGFRG